MERSSRFFAGVDKICVLRSNSLGDFIFILPALEALRSAYPAAELVILGKQWHAAFLEQRPGPFTRVIPVPFLPGINEGPSDPMAARQFFEAMRGEKFDLGVQLYGGGRFSNPFMKRIGCRFTVGMRAEDACGLDRTVPYIYYHHEVLRFLEVVSLAGALPVTLEPRLSVTQNDLSEALPFIRKKKPLAVLHPGATDPRRRWPARYFAAVGDALAETGVTIAINGVETERELVDECIQAMKHTPLDLCGKLSLCGLAGLLRHSELIVSNDTGPLHLARAVGTKSVGIYWLGNLINAGPLSLNKHPYHLSWRLDCPECGTNCIRSSCSHQASFVSDIPPEPVIRSALWLLKDGP